MEDSRPTERGRNERDRIAELEAVIARCERRISQSREAETKLRTILEATADMVVVIDQHGVFREVLASSEALLYAPANEVTGKTLRDVFSAEVADRFVQHVRDVLATHEAMTIEYALSINNEPGWFSCHTAPLEEDGRPPDLAISVIRDITARRSAEQLLRESEVRHRTMFDRVPAALYRSTPDGKIADANPALAEILGYPDQATLLAQSASNLFVNPDDRQKLNELLREHSNVRDYEVRLRRFDGSTIWVSDTCHAVKDDEGRILAYEGTMRDITERKLAEAALHKADRALKVLSLCNQTLVRARDEEGLLNKVGRLLVSVGQYRFAWVGRAPQKGIRCIVPMARAGHEEGYLDAVSFGCPDDDPLCAPCVSAVRSGVVAVVRNIAAEDPHASWRNEALRRGYASTVALPLVADGQLLGVLGIYGAEPDAFDEQELALLVELSNDVAFGIQALHTKAEREQAVSRLYEVLQATVEAVGTIAESRDPYTAGHQQRVTELACAIGEQLGLAHNVIEGIQVAGLLHDIGKMAVPAEFLS